MTDAAPEPDRTTEQLEAENARLRGVIRTLGRALAGLGSIVVLFLAAGVLAYVFVAPAFYGLDSRVNDLNNGRSPVSIAARTDRAEVRFLLCSRDATVVSEVKQEEVEFTCADYRTLEMAYQTQNVPDPRKPR